MTNGRADANVEAKQKVKEVNEEAKLTKYEIFHETTVRFYFYNTDYGYASFVSDSEFDASRHILH